jgi:hypothetical protein
VAKSEPGAALRTQGRSCTIRLTEKLTMACRASRKGRLPPSERTPFLESYCPDRGFKRLQTASIFGEQCVLLEKMIPPKVGLHTG